MTIVRRNVEDVAKIGRRNFLNGLLPRGHAEGSDTMRGIRQGLRLHSAPIQDSRQLARIGRLVRRATTEKLSP